MTSSSTGPSISAWTKRPTASGARPSLASSSVLVGVLHTSDHVHHATARVDLALGADHPAQPFMLLTPANRARRRTIGPSFFVRLAHDPEAVGRRVDRRRPAAGSRHSRWRRCWRSPRRDSRTGRRQRFSSRTRPSKGAVISMRARSHSACSSATRASARFAFATCSARCAELSC